MRLAYQLACPRCGLGRVLNQSRPVRLCAACKLAAAPIRDDWTQQAACRNVQEPDLFFDEHETKMAMFVCSLCPVVSQCLTHAIDNDEVGVWGGTTAGQRRKLSKGKTCSQQQKRKCPATVGVAH